MTAARVVAIGGGTGLPRLLTALLDVGAQPTAVVTVADDGGSSGWLRKTFGILPPGDIRNCLVAMARDPEGDLARAFSYRFGEGEGLAGHALGNLVIAALDDLSGSFAEAVRRAGVMLDVRGDVLPATLADCVLHAQAADGTAIEGQALISNSPRIACVSLEPPDPPAYGPVLEALASADAVILAPGSLYTSLLPNFLVAGVLDAVCAVTGPVTYVCNVANMRGETLGMDAADHVEALVEHGLGCAVDRVLVHDSEVVPAPPEADVATVVCGAAERRRIEEMGLEVIAADLADPADWRHHDRRRLAAVLPEVIG